MGRLTDAQKNVFRVMAKNNLEAAVATGQAVGLTVDEMVAVVRDAVKDVTPLRSKRRKPAPQGAEKGTGQ